MSYRQLTAIEVQVLEALGARQQREGFVPVEVAGDCPELVAVTVCRLMLIGLIEATPDGIPGDVTSVGWEWLRVHHLAARPSASRH